MSAAAPVAQVSKRYSLHPGEPERLGVVFTPGYSSMIVTYDGHEIGAAYARWELQQGRTFQLPSGEIVKLQLREQIGGPQLALELGGKPLVGTRLDPVRAVQQVVPPCIFAGASDVVLCVFMAGFGSDVQPQFYGIKLGLAATVVLVSMLASQLRSVMALVALLLLLVGDGVSTVVLSIVALGTNAKSLVFLLPWYLLALKRVVATFSRFDELLRQRRGGVWREIVGAGLLVALGTGAYALARFIS